MKRLFYSFAIILSGICLFSCESEDALEPDYKNPSDYFQPAADDNSEEAQLRRKFFADYGSYLLFNDTLQNVYLGKDINGDPRYFVETIDLTYTVGQTGYGTSLSSYTFTYIPNFEQKLAMTEYLETYILPHFSDAMRPYSWLLTKTIIGKMGKDDSAQTISPYAVVNQRCVAVACNYLTQRERTEAQKKNYASRVLNIMVSSMVKAHTDAFGEFEAVSHDYYGRSYSSLGLEDVNQEKLYQYGFLVAGSTVGYMTDLSTDISSYASNVVTYTDEQLEQRYGKYELVMLKHRLMKQTLERLGYIF